MKEHKYEIVNRLLHLNLYQSFFILAAQKLAMTSDLLPEGMIY